MKTQLTIITTITKNNILITEIKIILKHELLGFSEMPYKTC